MSGYNGSEPTRICPKCGKENPLVNLDLEIWEKGILETNHGVKAVDDYNDGSRGVIRKIILYKIILM